MARLTFDQLVTQGGVLGGNDAVSTWIGTKFRAWLRKQAAAWPWPFLVTQATGIALASGSASLLVGAGDGGLTPQICRIFSPVYFRAGGYTSRGKAPLRMIVGGPAESAMGNIDPSSLGQPLSFVAQQQFTVAGKFQTLLTPYPVPDQDYTLAFTYQSLPEDPTGTEVPWYPDEDTMIQATKLAAIEYDQGDSPYFQQQVELLAGKVTADRDTYGGDSAFGNMMQLDDSVYPTDDQGANISNKMGW